MRDDGTRHIVWFAALASLVFTLGACGGGGDDNDNDDQQLTDAGPTDVATDVRDDGSAPETDGGAEDTTADTTEADTGADTGPSFGECIQTCENARDCGFAEEWVCEEDGYCDFHECNEDTECLPSVSEWAPDCSVGECNSGEVCVEHNGATYCAFEAEDDGSCENVPSSAFESTTKPKADGSGEVEVCANPRASCSDDNTCEGGLGEPVCTDDSFCEGDLQCEPDLGGCVCETDQQCIDAENGDNWECVE